MGAGYQVSPLHKVIYVEPVEGAPVKAAPPHILEVIASMPPDMPKMHWDGRPHVFRSPPAEDIIAWRKDFCRQHQSELGEDVDWDEKSAFEWSEDMTSGDKYFRYVAAVIDQNGADGLARIAGLQAPPDGAMASAFAATDRRGSAVRFPQLLMGAQYWLPFKRRVVITSTTWRGDTARFGSVDALAVELNEICALIA
jgi:hypothetical protein